jgi:tRNA threonylcarbamoyladenosine biosynthesis protein TsaE
MSGVNNAERKIVTRGPEETHRVARELLETLKPGAVLALHGELGAGKTCFVQGLARAMGVRRVVSSPTFTLINEYTSAGMRLHHVDLYRIRDSREALDLGLDEYIHGDGITAIEWAERIADLLPETTVHIRMTTGKKPDERAIVIRSGGSE